MARYLAPEDFGLVAIVFVVLQGVELFTDIGLEASIIQSNAGNLKRFRDTAWTLAIIRGLLISATLSLLALPTASFFEKPDLTDLLYAVSVIPAISGFRSTAISIAGREMQVARLASAGILGQLVSLCTMLVYVQFDASAWALVAGAIGNALVMVSLSHTFFGTSNDRLDWEWTSVKAIFRFGKWIFLSSLIAYLASQIDRLVLAKILAADVLGFYTIGFIWARMPFMVLQKVMRQVLFPLASKTIREDKDGTSDLERYRSYVLWLSTFFLGVYATCLEPVYRLLYTAEYWPSMEYSKVLLVGTFIGIAELPNRYINLAAGRPSYEAYGGLLAVILFVISVFPLYACFEGLGVAWSYVISRVGPYFLAVYGTHQTTMVRTTSTRIQIDVLAISAYLFLWFVGGELSSAVRW